MRDERRPAEDSRPRPALELTPLPAALLLIGCLVLVVLLGLLLQPAVRGVIALPIAYAGWLIGLVLKSVPGVLWWAWLLIMVVIIASKSLKGRAEAPPTMPREPVIREGPATTWFHRINLSRHSEYFRWRLAHELGRLALGLSAYREGSSVTRAGQHRAAGLNGPPEITAYLSAGLGTAPEEPLRGPASLMDVPSWVRDRWRLRGQPAARRSPLALPPEEIIAFLERELE
jgi:hypothetical protein